MADVNVSQSRGRSKHSKKKGRRIAIRIDMTPMVDIAFLLLTFFMLTTSMQKPQTMEINLPPSETSVEVAQSNLVTIRVVPEEKDTIAIYWNIGIDKPKRIEASDREAEIVALGKLLKNQLQANPRMITLIKVDKKAHYDDMVDIMDQLNLSDITRFSLEAFDDNDMKLIQNV
jgi:biopolymer transport protein ExbD